MKSLLKKYGASPLPQVMVRQASKQRQVTLEELTAFCKFLSSCFVHLNWSNCPTG